MNKGNTKFYHEHISQNIVKLDERKDGFVDHRRKFLVKYCLPIQKKIQDLKEKIKYYENMRDTQFEVIENNQDILRLKGQIKQYLNTNNYFENKLDEYVKTTISLEENNQKIKQKLRFIKSTYRKDYLNQAQNKTQRSLFASRIGSHTVALSQLNIPVQIQEQSKQRQNKLPVIRKPSKYYVFYKQKKKVNPSLYTSIQPSQGNLDFSILTQNPEELTNKKARQLISQFDKTEGLFKECFQKKKAAVQKNVSQLQSKLITNKQSFLKACQVIGEKEGKLTFEEFCDLTGDQIITLFISFGWLNRKVYSEFMKKRKIITNMMNKLPDF